LLYQPTRGRHKAQNPSADSQGESQSICAARRLDAEFRRDGYLRAAGFNEGPEYALCFTVPVVTRYVEVSDAGVKRSF
jgi:hypothetical protein